MNAERLNFRKTKAPPKDQRGRVQVSLALIEEMEELVVELQKVRPAYSVSKTQIVEAGIRIIMDTIRRDIAAFQEM